MTIEREAAGLEDVGNAASPPGIGAEPTDVIGGDHTPDLPFALPSKRALEIPDLGRRAVSGVLVTTAFTILWEVGKGVSGLVTAHFLRAEDYALVGVAAFALGFGVALTNFSIDTRLVQVYEDPGEAYDVGFTLLLLLGVFNVLFALAIGPLVASVYHDSVLVPIVFVLALQQLAGAFTLPNVYLQRELRWWRQRLISTVGPLTTIILTLFLAVRGYGVWALVLGQLTGAVVTAAVLWIQAPVRPRLHLKFTREQLRFFSSFGGPLWIGGLVFVITQNAILFQIQAVLGLAMLGFLRLAVGLGERIDKAEHVLGSVLLPVLARTRDDGRLRRAYDMSAKLILIWSVPTGFGLAIFSSDIVNYILGPQWGPVVPLLKVEGVGEVFNAIATMWEVFYLARGKTRPSLWLGLQINIMMAVMIGIAALLFGYRGVIVTIFAAVVVGLVQRRRYMKKLLPGVAVIRPAIPMLGAGVVASGVVFILGQLFGLGDPPGLAIRVLAFLTTYALIVAVVQREFLRDGLKMVRRREFVV